MDTAIKANVLFGDKRNMFKNIKKWLDNKFERDKKEAEEEEKKSPEKRFFKEALHDIIDFGSIAFFMIPFMMLSLVFIYGGQSEYESFKTNIISNVTFAASSTINSIEEINNKDIIFGSGKMLYFWLWTPLIAIIIMIIYLIWDFIIYLRRKSKFNANKNGTGKDIIPKQSQL